MKTKRITAVILACIMALTMTFALSACNGDEGQAPANDTNTDNGSNSAGTADNAGKVLEVGVKQDVPGFGLKDPATGEYSGMEIDLAYLIAEALGYDDVEFTTVTAQTRGELLDSGDLDCVIATFTIRPDRRELWDFSTPYFVDAVTVLVENDSGIATLADLVGKTIGVSTSSTSAYALVNAMAEAGLLPDYEVPESADFSIPGFSEQGTSFTEYADYPAISNALAAGTVDAFCVDKSILAGYKTDSRSYIDAKFSPQEYGVATKKDGPMSAPIEELIVKWLADGTIDGLIEKHGVN